MNFQKSLPTILTIALPVIGLFVVFLVIQNNLDYLKTIAEKHTLVAPFLLISWRVLSIVIPPLPGGIVSLALLPVFGWFKSFLYGTLGVVLGTTIAFYLARHFREPLVKKIVPLKHLHEWEKQYSERKKFLAFLGIRLLTAPVCDFLSYVAGLSRISFRTFFLTNLIALLPDALLYYAGEVAYKRSLYLGFALVFIVAIGYYVVGKSHHLIKKKIS